MTELHLLEPEPSVRWAPFAGVRPIAELRAGAWRIRERWEHALGIRAAGIHGAHCSRFSEDDEPPVRSGDGFRGPGIVAARYET